MRSISVLILSVIGWCCLSSISEGQQVSVFGAPSMLPTQEAGVSWQGGPGAYPTTNATELIANQGTPNPPKPVPTIDPLVAPTFDPADTGACWGESVCCAPSCGPTWYAVANGLIFTRNDPKFSQLSFDDTNLVGQVLSTDSGLGRWDAGAEIRIGWILNPCWTLEFTYWGLYGDNQEATAFGASLPGNLNSALDFSPLNIGATNVNDLYDGAAAHRIRRDYDVNNVELNLLRGYAPWFQETNWRVSYLAGMRYLRFTEDFQYASADANPIFGADPGNEAYYDIDVENNLWGFQLGGRADWYCTPRFSIYASTKFGIYGNYMQQHSRIHNANGTATVGPGNPLAGEAFDIATDKTITSFIGELDLGLNYRFAARWSAMIGYRAVAISGLAYATDQIPSNLADLPGVADVASNANMILHGGYAGVVFGW